MLIRKLSKIGLFSLFLAASFYVSAFAGYDFSQEGSSANTTYRGTNEVYSNGIYVGTDPNTGLPIYEFEMDNQNNTYNGDTTIIGGGSALFDGYDQNSTYNGDLSIEGYDVGSETVTSISGANINATSTIEAFEANSQNDLNAGVLIQDSTFNKDVTITNSTVNLDSQANVILGSSSQMDTLLNYTNSINIAINNLFNGTNYMLGHIYIIEDNIKNNRNSTTAQTISLPSTSPYSTASYDLIRINQYTYTITDNNIVSSYEVRYVNFHGHLMVRLNEIKSIMRQGYTLVKNNLVTLQQNVTSFHTYVATYIQDLFFRLYSQIAYSVFGTSDNVQMTYNGTTYTLDLDRTDLFGTYYYCNARGMFMYHLNSILTNLRNRLNVAATDSDPSGYIYTVGGYPVLLQKHNFRTYSYNTTTNKFEYNNSYFYCTFIGFLYQTFYNYQYAGFKAYFDYLNALSPGSIINQSVSNLDTTITNLNNAETTLQNSVSNSISSFIPSTGMFGSFIALSWCSNYLQQIFTSLGLYGTVIMVGLLLGVCMQFIGYFRYKY